MVRKFEKQTTQIVIQKYNVQQITAIHNSVWKIGYVDNNSRTYQ